MAKPTSSGPTTQRPLDKAIDRPIGLPDPAREEAPVGWVLDPDGAPSLEPPGEGHGGAPVGPGHRDPPLQEDTPIAAGRPGAPEASDESRGAGGADAAHSGDSGAGYVLEPEPRASSLSPNLGGGQQLPFSGPVHTESMVQPAHQGGPETPSRLGVGGGGGGHEASRPGDGSANRHATDGTTDHAADVAVPPQSAPPHLAPDHIPPVTAGTATPTLGPTPQVVPPHLAPDHIPPVTAGTATPTLGPTPQVVPPHLAPDHIPPVTAGTATPTLGPTPQVVPPHLAPDHIPPVTAGTATPHLNRPAGIGGESTGRVTEDVVASSGRLETSGRLTITDVDAGEAHFVARQGVVGDHGFGRFNIDEQGHWTYSADNSQWNIQRLVTGGTVTDSFTATSADGTRHTVTVTIAGADDRAVVTGDSTGTVTEDLGVSRGSLVAQGQLHVADPDFGQNTFGGVQGGPGQNGYGHFEMVRTGGWTYRADNSQPAIQQLKAGEKLTDSFVVHSADGTPHTVTVTIVGTNDAPVISGESTGRVTEDVVASSGRLETSGRLTITDVDAGEAHFVARQGVVGDHGFGRFNIDEQGHWTYSADNSQWNIQRLVTGGTVTDSFTATSADGTRHTVTVTIAGADDRAVVTGDSTGTVTEDLGVSRGSLVAQGQLHVADPDFGQNTFGGVQGGPGQNGYGHFEMVRTGGWTYRADNSQPAIQQLRAGEKLTDSFVVHSADGTPHTVTVTIVGTNDAPVIAGTHAASGFDLGQVAEDQSHTFTSAELLRMLAPTDVDHDTVSISDVHVDSTYGTIARSGNDWVFTPAANAHHAGVPVMITVTDGHATVAANAHLDLTPVTDAASATVHVVAEQHVMEFHDGHAGAVLHAGALQTHGNMDALALELTVLGGAQVTTAGIHGATLVSYATSGTADGLNEFYIWKPESLTVRIGGHDYDTGVSMGADADSHRFSFVWSSTAGTLDVLRDGQSMAHLDHVARGYHIPGGGTLAFGNDLDTVGGGFSREDAWHGRLFSATLATGSVTPGQLAQTQLRDLLHGSPQLVIDIQAQGNNHLVDTTGHHTIISQDGVTTPTVQVDTSIANPLPGALLHLTPAFVAPTDSDDHVSALRLAGFPAGTVLDDHAGHSVTVTGAAQEVDIHDWSTTGLTAQLPAGSRENLAIGIEVETTGPDGATALAHSTASVVVDASQPLAPDPFVPATHDMPQGHDAPTEFSAALGAAPSADGSADGLHDALPGAHSGSATDGAHQGHDGATVTGHDEPVAPYLALAAGSEHHDVAPVASSGSDHPVGSPAESYLAMLATPAGSGEHEASDHGAGLDGADHGSAAVGAVAETHFDTSAGHDGNAAVADYANLAAVQPEHHDALQSGPSPDQVFADSQNDPGLAHDDGSSMQPAHDVSAPIEPPEMPDTAAAPPEANHQGP